MFEKNNCQVQPKETQKSNFRQYGQMKSRNGKSQRREEEERGSEKRKNQKKEDGARKGRTVAGGLKSRLAKARGVERVCLRGGSWHDVQVVVRSS